MPEDVVARALAALEAGLPAMLDELAGLIAVDTSFPPGAGYAAWATHLEGLLGPMRFHCERVEVPPALWACPGSHGDRVNLIARRRGAGRQRRCIYFHSDTVPAGSGWATPPLELTRSGDRLIGRGTADMKGSVAAVLGAIRALDAAGADYAVEPVLLFCTDEEGGLYPGARYLAETGRIEDPVLCLNGQAEPRIWAGCFGSLDLRLRLDGRAAHSGNGANGVNAIEESVPVLAALGALGSRVAQRTSALAPRPGQPPLHPRLSVTAAHGGARGSSLPERFEIVVNRRYMPEEQAGPVIDEIRECVGQAAAGTGLLGWELDVAGHLAPVTDPGDDGLWPRWLEALSRGFGWPREGFRTWGSTSSSDMGWLQANGHREILLGGLGRPDRNVHAADEHTTVGDLLGLARAVLLYLSADFARAA